MENIVIVSSSREKAEIGYVSTKKQTMNPLKKAFLYPIVITGIIMLVTLCNWLITAFFALVFDTTISDIALSPIILLYIGSGLATLYLCVSACQYIDEEL